MLCRGVKFLFKQQFDGFDQTELPDDWTENGDPWFEADPEKEEIVRFNNGIIVKNSTPNKYFLLMKSLLEKAKKQKYTFVFINAWNEWAEGALLEPDVFNGYEYLESNKRARKKE